MKTYTTLESIKHDGKDVKVGATLDLDDEEAAALIACGAIKADATAAAPTDPAERQAAIIVAIGQLDTANNDLWLKDGKPDVGALSTALGYTIAAAERNEAWATINAPK